MWWSCGCVPGIDWCCGVTATIVMEVATLVSLLQCHGGALFGVTAMVLRRWSCVVTAAVQNVSAMLFCATVTRPWCCGAGWRVNSHAHTCCVVLWWCYEAIVLMLCYPYAALACRCCCSNATTSLARRSSGWNE